MSNLPENIYSRLPGRLLPWYEREKRELPWRRDRKPYHILVSEIMLQQTRVEAVRGYYDRFLAALPTPEALAACPEEKLLKLWEGLGYYSRARNLQKSARAVIENYGGRFPDSYERLLSLPGVGPYTAGAIASICFERPCAAVDGNVLRVIARLTGDDRPIDLFEVKAEVSDRLGQIYPKGRCGDFTQALMELGAIVCTPRSPRCAACPVAEICLARGQNRVETLPIRSPKKPKRVEERTVFLLQCGGDFALCRREEKGLLSGLWQFPNVEGHLSLEKALSAAQEAGVQPTELCRSLQRTHIFTHIRWEMVGYHILCARAAEGFTWASLQEIRERYALPTAFRQFLDAPLL